VDTWGRHTELSGAHILVQEFKEMLACIIEECRRPEDELTGEGISVLMQPDIVNVFKRLDAIIAELGGPKEPQYHADPTGEMDKEPVEEIAAVGVAEGSADVYTYSVPEQTEEEKEESDRLQAEYAAEAAALAEAETSLEDAPQVWMSFPFCGAGSHSSVLCLLLKCSSVAFV
jgi:hypothetical protein